jgi:hypothetical protein
VHVRVEDSVALVGVIAAPESTGALFVTVTLAEPLPVPLSTSVAVAVQVMMSPLKAVVADSVRLEVVPRVLEPFVQT